MSKTKSPNAFTTIKHVRKLKIKDGAAKAVLLLLATYADGPTGEGALCSQKTLVKQSGFSESTVRRKLHWLMDNGFIREGDQSRADYIRADKRPVVYDVVLPQKPPRLHGVSR